MMNLFSKKCEVILLLSCGFFSGATCFSIPKPPQDKTCTFRKSSVSSTVTSSELSIEKREIPGNYHFLILPGFGNDAVDYTMPRSIIASLLSTTNITQSQTTVLPVQRSDWIQVFTKGIFDLDFWLGNASPKNPAFGWYLDLIQQEMNRVSSLDQNTKFILLGHSAGGWLARAAMGYYGEIEKEVIALVTLGTPNASPPPGMDMTRGALRITNEDFPGCYYNETLLYMTVIGNAIKGIKQKRTFPWEPTTPTGFAYNSYEVVCGTGDVDGDGVVPIEAAHLDGSLEIELQSVFHSINVPEQWYGSEAIILKWLDALLQELDCTSSQTTKNKENISFNLWQTIQQNLFNK